MNVDKFLKLKVKRKLIHVHVDADVHARVTKLLKAEKIKWRDLIDACLKSWVEGKK